MEEDRHEVLYIKNRPQTFDEVRGQDLIVQALRGQIIHGRVSHAYLFSGIRGTGKTTVARIFARAINCEHPVHGNPCNVCPTCQAMLRDQSINLTEMNAADQGRVEDIRDLERIISTPPVTGVECIFKDTGRTACLRGLYPGDDGAEEPAADHSLPVPELRVPAA